MIQRRIKDLAGIKFNHLTAIEHVGSWFRFEHGRRKTNALWKFRCDCGNYVHAAAPYVTRGFKKSCGCHVRHGWLSVAWHTYNKGYNDGDISFEQFTKLTQLPCHYCGKAPSNKNSYHGNTWIYNGLDRKDSNLKHTLDNCVVSCFPCNDMKSNWSYEEFMDRIKRIYERNFL